MTSYVFDWCPRIDFDSSEPIARHPRYRCATALPQEPFEPPQAELSYKCNAHLKFEDEPEETPPQKVEADWPRYYILRAPFPEKLLDITSDEPLPLK